IEARLELTIDRALCDSVEVEARLVGDALHEDQNRLDGRSESERRAAIHARLQVLPPAVLPRTAPNAAARLGNEVLEPAAGARSLAALRSSLLAHVLRAAC